MSAEGFVYFVLGDDKIKIGWSRNVALRLSQLQTAAAAELELLGSMPGTRDLERALHTQFGALRVRGEWFRAEPGLLAAIPWICGQATGRRGADRYASRNAWSHALDHCFDTIRNTRPCPEDQAAHVDILARIDELHRFAKHYSVFDSSPCGVNWWDALLPGVPGFLSRWIRRERAPDKLQARVAHYFGSVNEWDVERVAMARSLEAAGDA